MKEKKNVVKLFSIFLAGVITIYTPLTVLASNMNVFVDGTEESLPESEIQQEIFDSGDEVSEKNIEQESFMDNISENINFDEAESVAENFEELNEIEDTVETAGDAADLFIGNYECTISENKITITKYSGTDEYIVVPSSLAGYEVTAIGNRAFANCTNLKTITLPEGLKSIGYSFISGTGVTSLTVPKTVTEGGYYYHGNGVTDGAGSLEEVIFEDGMKKIPDHFCSNAKENSVLTNVKIPESVNEIGGSAFYNCSGLKEIILGETIRTIGNSAFYNCKGLRKVEFRENKEYTVTVGNTAFLNCTSLEKVVCSQSVNEIGNGAFKGCISLNRVILPEGIKKIGNEVFFSCSNLKTITLPEGLKSIGYSFIAGTDVTSLTVPKTVTEGGYYYHGNGVTDGAGSLEEVIFEDGMEKIPDHFCSNAKENSVLTNVKIPKSVTEIGGSAFYNCSGLKEIILGETIRTIGNSAFYNCKGLRKVEFRENKEYTVTVGDTAFLNCTSLEEVVCSQSVNEIGNGAFKGCISLNRVILPEGIKKIGNEVFFSCSNLKTITLPEGLKSIGYSFISGTGVTSLTVPKTVTEGGYYYHGNGVTDGAGSLEEVIFEDGMEKIPDHFCSNAKENGVLTNVKIPKSVTEIGKKAFYNCISVTIYGYANSYSETYAKNEKLPFTALKDKDTIDISKAKISGVQEIYEYTGKSIKPVPKVTLKNNQLTVEKDYNISYSNNKRVGTATITITGKGNYSGFQIIEFRITVMKNDIERSAVSFANIFAKKAKSTNSTATINERRQLEKLGNQLTVTGYKEELPDEVLEAFATSVLNTIKDSNIDKFETNQNKLAKQIYKQIKGGIKSGSEKIILGNGSKKITYTVSYTIFAQSFWGNGAQVSWANVKWKDTKNKSYSVHIVANSKGENMKLALSSYCAVLAQLNKDVWKEFLTKYITDGWKLAGLNTVKKLDDKTVSNFFNRSEKLILSVCGDQNAKKVLANDAEKALKEKLLKMTKKQFQNFIKNNISGGNEIILAADQYKKLIDKYNDYKKKFNKWNKTRKDGDLTKSEKAYQECEDLLEILNESLKKIS